MGDRTEIAAAVRAALASLWPGRFDADQLTDDVSVGEDGLGLDSIEIVEFLLECEERVGVSSDGGPTPLDGGPVSLGRLIDFLARA